MQQPIASSSHQQKHTQHRRKLYIFKFMDSQPQWYQLHIYNATHDHFPSSNGGAVIHMAQYWNICCWGSKSKKCEIMKRTHSSSVFNNDATDVSIRMGITAGSLRSDNWMSKGHLWPNPKKQKILPHGMSHSESCQKNVSLWSLIKPPARQCPRDGLKRNNCTKDNAVLESKEDL